MAKNVAPKIMSYGAGYANWLQLICDLTSNYYEIAIAGPNAKELLKEVQGHYIPNKLIAGSQGKSTIPLMHGRFHENDSYIYVCVDGACKLPEKEVKKALDQIKTAF